MRDCQPRNLFLKIFMYKDLKCIKHASGKLKGLGGGKVEGMKNGLDKTERRARQKSRLQKHHSESQASWIPVTLTCRINSAITLELLRI